MKKIIVAMLFAPLLALSLAVTSLMADGNEVIFATTTSTQDTGLLDVLVPLFQKRTGYFIKVIAVGSGQAMTLGRRGEADLLLVHSAEAEKKFMEEKFGVNRRLVMHNDFVVLGPAGDPANIKGAKSPAAAFKAIAAKGCLFVSRGDDSGTHVKEKSLWAAAGVSPDKQPWYQQTGLGMGQTLRVASEKGGYTLADRGTYLSQKKTLSLNILVSGDTALHNIYHLIEVNPAKWPKVNAKGARAFADFLLSKEVQGIIGNFGKAKYGEPLFFPDAVK